MIRIQVRVAVANGWLTFVGNAPDGSDRECYAMPPAKCRAAYWSRKLGQDIPPGRGLIWTIV